MGVRADVETRAPGAPPPEQRVDVVVEIADGGAGAASDRYASEARRRSAARPGAVLQRARTARAMRGSGARRRHSRLPGGGCALTRTFCAVVATPQDAEAALASALASCFTSPSGGGAALDWPALAVVPGRSAWTLAIEALVVSSDGSVLDALSIAAKAALADTQLPQARVGRSSASRALDTR